jgi:putative FmdB family regulatory protein
MPVYEYECSNCGQSFERLQNVGARAPRTCPSCEKAGTVRRRVSAPAFQFKGSGWYITDYAGKGRGGAQKSEGSEAGGDDTSGKANDGKADSKADSKADKAESKADKADTKTAKSSAAKSDE